MTRDHKKDYHHRVEKRSKDRRKLQYQRLIRWSVAVLAIVLSVILGVGAYRSIKLGTSPAIATVNGAPILVDAYQKHLLYLEEVGQIEPGHQTQVELVALQELVDAELIRQGAEQMGILITEEEVQQEIYRMLKEGVEEARADPLDQEQLQYLYQLQLARVKERFGMTEDDFRDLFRQQLLADRVGSVLADQVGATGEHAHVQHILVSSEEEAEAVVRRLAEGEDFAAIAAELSLDERTKEQGGDLGWFPRDTYPPVFEEAVFALDAKGDIDIVKTASGFHVVMLVERDPDRPFDSETLEYRRKTAFDTWRQQLRMQADITYDVELYRELFVE